MVSRDQLTSYLEGTFHSERYRDCIPNGLQISGADNVGCIVSAVSISQAVIEQAIDLKAQAILVHHGLFYHKTPLSISGHLKERISALLAHDISLYACHLPLDTHPDFNNNLALAAHCGWQVDPQPLMHYQGHPLGCIGRLSTPQRLSDFVINTGHQLQRAPTLYARDPERMITTLAWCTGAGQHFIEHARRHRVDLYLSGEVSEQTYYYALEEDIPYLCIGHHASERYGVQVLGQHLADKWQLQHHYVDIPNPV